MFPLSFAILALATCLPAESPGPASPASLSERSAAPALSANELYSRQARRRMAHYLRLRLLELRAAKLERVSKVVRGELSIDELLREEPP